MSSKTDLKKLNLTKEQALDLLRQMWEIRMFEDRVYDLLGRDIIKGASHLYAGEEAVAVGAISALRDDDLITSTHRGHGGRQGGDLRGWVGRGGIEHQAGGQDKWLWIWIL